MASCDINANASEERMPKKRKTSTKTCIKCKQDNGCLVLRGLVYCRKCTQALVTQKFKRVIDEVIDPHEASDAVLAIGYSGGLGSSLILHLVAQSLCPSTRRTRRHTWDRIHVVYIEQDVVSGYIDHKVELKEIESVVAKYPHFHLTKVPLEKCFEGDLYSDPPRESLLSYLGGLPTRSAINESIQIMTRRLLERTVKSLGVSHLLLGRSLSSVSIALLSSICSGRGSTIGEERQSSQEGVVSLNPLRELGSKECAACVWWYSLNVISSPILHLESGGSTASISRLTRAFLSGIEKDYPSTVFTIAKTCAKVVPKENNMGICALCFRNAPTSEEQFGASSVISASSQDLEDSSLRLCYACKTLLTSGNSRSTSSMNTSPLPLPIWGMSTPNTH
ncbi:hypothetical protein FRB91_001421 [Serendipita sp. 411]|nr:hypothetical protein FRB91_001421 [Serendipita sp. 411]